MHKIESVLIFNNSELDLIMESLLIHKNLISESIKNTEDILTIEKLDDKHASLTDLIDDFIYEKYGVV